MAEGALRARCLSDPREGATEVGSSSQRGQVKRLERSAAAGQLREA